MVRANEDTLAITFSVFGCKDQMYEYAQTHHRPVIFSTPIGLLWIAGLEKVEGRFNGPFSWGLSFSPRPPCPASGR